MSSTRGIAVSTPISETQSRNRTFMIPDLVSDLADGLVERIATIGFRTNRAELISALIVKMNESTARDLEQDIRTYLSSDISAALNLSKRTKSVTPKAAQPGPRPRRARVA